MAVIGALVIAWSSILVRLADVSPSTAAIFRCAYALPLLVALAWREDRRLGPRPARGRRLAAGAGVFFAADLICWHHAIADVGAGLATVLGNLQVAFVPLVAWAVLERASRAPRAGHAAARARRRRARSPAPSSRAPTATTPRGACSSARRPG